ncbi:MAG TPA: hypothetical protein VII27_08170 [Thermoplasmata archaeon]
MRESRKLSRLGVIAALGVLFVLALAVVPPAAASGVSPAKLTKAGWDCIVVFGALHCAPPGGFARVLSGTAETMTFLVFGTTTEAPFLGTELIIRADLFHGQPCPQDPPSMEYTYLFPLIGLDYYACHHYDSSF